MKINKLTLALLASGCILNAHAAVATGSFEVTANILGSCEISADPMNFGSIRLNEGAQASNQILVNCPVETNGYLTIDGGLNLDNDQRQLVQQRGGTDHFVKYDLYVDSARTSRYATFLSGGFGGRSITGVGEPEAIEVFGTIPIQDSKPSGQYTDTVQVRIDY